MNRDGLAEHLRRHPHRAGIVVCPDNKWIWMKPGKTAGSSISRRALEPHLNLVHSKKTPEAFAAWLDGITDEALEEWFIWATIRNPYARLVSALAYFHIEPMDFFTDPGKHIWGRPGFRVHTVPQHFYTHMSGRRFVNAYVHVEGLQADFDVVRSRLGCPPCQLPVMNRSKHRPWKEVFEMPVTRDIVAVLWSRDFVLHGYYFL